MSKMGLSCFTDGYNATELVAPKSNYLTKEEFIHECKEVYDHGYDWYDRVKIENVNEGHCRYFRIPPEGIDIDGGCYSFSKEGAGAFPVWYIALS